MRAGLRSLAQNFRKIQFVHSAIFVREEEYHQKDLEKSALKRECYKLTGKFKHSQKCLNYKKETKLVQICKLMATGLMENNRTQREIYLIRSAFHRIFEEY
ncbi:UNKNOWN [Stylonychia lemnae]|uniref:Uncharacterized protein n=1 Tax=Stylonychia lemnae TaxID=5949 RepID=A0A078A7W2_STYLE|nr:UNKNOWN [Stylonychia lemnae]|eukprot:CDW77662.1 UNKNOWN [Stylonychia lemnae]